MKPSELVGQKHEAKLGKKSTKYAADPNAKDQTAKERMRAYRNRKKAAAAAGIVTPPVVKPAVNRRLKFPKRAIDRLFKAGFDGRISAAEWRTYFATLETSHGACPYGKEMFGGARERMETTIQYRERLFARLNAGGSLMGPNSRTSS
jgi:hypothetical protein